MLDTQPFVAADDQLIVNATCGNDGYVKVAVTDEDGAALPGRGWDDCDVFSGDDVRHRVTWRSDPSPPMPAEQESLPSATPYRKLKFLMRNADLYSFRVVSNEKEVR